MTSIRVLDASVLIAAMLREPGGQDAIERASERRVSAVNLAEVRSKLVDRGWAEEAVDESLALLDTPVEPFTEMDARQVAFLRGLTRQSGLSIGDRACIALAQRLGAAVMTADRNWAGIGLPVEVELIR